MPDNFFGEIGVLDSIESDRAGTFQRIREYNNYLESTLSGIVPFVQDMLPT